MNVDALRKSFEKVLEALRTHGTELAAIPGLAAARPGYDTSGGALEPALVLAFHPGREMADVAALAAKLGVRVRTATASVAEQLRGATSPSFASPLGTLLEPTEAPGFAPPERGTYEPPTGPAAPKLTPVDEEMELTICASPDAGWPVLRDFLGEGAKERLTVAMYDFTANHVRDALLKPLEAGTATFRLVIDGKPASGGVGGNGVNGPDSPEDEVMTQLREALGPRFELARASVGAGGAVPKAYHIKVAVEDGDRMWLSSGNWQSSNLPPFDRKVPGSKPPLPIGRYNRDYHVVVRNPALARCYAGFIEYDATLGGPFAAEAAAEPFLLVPEGAAEEPEAFAPKRTFDPLSLKRRVKVTPLLTPDNFPTFVNELVATAEHRVWIQNQYIQPKAEGDNFPEFDRLMELLGELAGKVDLRLCLRGIEDADRDRLLAAGVQPDQIRRQGNCHAKLIIVDDAHVIVGSQNLSNVGFVANRDASLAFEDPEITKYFADVFEEDWDHATPVRDGESFGVHVARGDATPAGFVRVPWSDIFDAPPPEVPALSGVATTPAPVPSSPAVARAIATPSAEKIPLFGVDESGARGSEDVAATAAAIRAAGGSVDAERRDLGIIAVTPSFGLPPGVDDEDDLSQTGWGVVWAPNTPKEVKEALSPLLAHRMAAVADPLLFHEIDYVPGQSARQFLQQRGIDFGALKPSAVPYHLLIVGGPDQIPFTFQSVLDVGYRVGRLDLPDATAYQRYAASVVATETGAAKARDRVLHAFGPAHAGDAPTALSVQVLVRAAAGWLDAFPKLKQKHALTTRTDAADAATKARLLEIVRGGAGRPEVLFTAGHGLLVPAGKPQQATDQGALVTADWDGFGGLTAASRFAAADLPGDADVLGMVAFLFACFGAGTPSTDSFPVRAGQPLAPKPFIAALPRALLSHANGAALGVFGHVDRTLTWSLQPPQAPVATEPFAHAALQVLAGRRLGAALQDLNERGAVLAAQMAAALQPGAPPVGDVELVRTWTQQRDASAFILLGDPAARLPR